MVEVRQITKSYEQKMIYSAFSLAFETDKVTAVLGPSGCGKTTLLKMIAGLVPYESGEIVGVDKKSLAYLFQEDRLLPQKNVRENIGWVLQSKYPQHQIKEEVDKMLAFLQLEAYGEYKIAALSGGMKRRVALGRALIYPSNVLLMDEPFKGLDETLKYTLLEKLKQRWKETPQTVVFVTHDVEEANYLADCLCYLKGKH